VSPVFMVVVVVIPSVVVAVAVRLIPAGCLDCAVDDFV